MVQPRIKLVLLFGGRSAEHDVSRVTASHVMRAVDPARYELVPVAIDRDGSWHLAADALAALAEGPDALPDALAVSGPDVDPLPLLATRPATEPGSVDASEPATVVALPLLHGPFGEDGTVQGLLELAGVPYVGAGVLASSLAMDKAKAREVFAYNGIPQARWLAWRADEVPADPAGVAGEQLGFPCFVKPANLGSSVGVSKAHDETEFATALDLALSYDEWVVVEEAITGREIELAVLGNTDPAVSVAGEIVPGAEFYDYEDKYHDGRAKLVIPAPLPAAVAERFQRLAIAAFRACRAEGMARVDFFYEEDGPARGPLLNEVNTIPGFTPISMYPKLWQASGVSYPQLIDRLIALALERHHRRQARTRTDR
ncbi:MAG: D-alanine--D-alanine ligase [Acidimicrobiales bacterium]|nr:D-alanine--D-alanine ligase [Acidimicrobiales bacterium]